MFFHVSEMRSENFSMAFYVNISCDLGAMWKQAERGYGNKIFAIRNIKFSLFPLCSASLVIYLFCLLKREFYSLGAVRDVWNMI